MAACEGGITHVSFDGSRGIERPSGSDDVGRSLGSGMARSSVGRVGAGSPTAENVHVASRAEHVECDHRRRCYRASHLGLHDSAGELHPPGRPQSGAEGRAMRLQEGSRTVNIIIIRDKWIGSYYMQR